MAWVDGNSVGLGCLGFSSKAGYRRSNSPLAINVCKKAHSKAHLVEIYNKSQIRFMMSAKVENYVYSKIGARGWTWWIGGEGKHGRWKDNSDEDDCGGRRTGVDASGKGV